MQKEITLTRAVLDGILFLIKATKGLIPWASKEALTPKWLEAGRDNSFPAFFVIGGSMKKTSSKINYKAYDGNYYAVLFRDWPKEQARDYLIKTYGHNVPFPIKFIDCNCKSKQWKFWEVREVESIEEADPIARLGDNKSRCPYCSERKCLISLYNKDICGISYPKRDDPDEPEELFGNKRFIGPCLSRKNKGKYFIAEYRQSHKATIDMLERKQCPLCKAYNSLTVIQLVNTSSSRGFLKEIEEKLSEESKQSIRGIKGIEYTCRSCNAKEMIFFRGAENNSYYCRIKEVYFKN